MQPAGFKCEKMAAELRHRITAGEYPRGGRLPAAPDLAQSFGVSYVTAQKALQLLAHDGYITLKKHVGSTVTYIQDAPQPTRKVVNLLTTISEHPALQEFLDDGREIFAAAGWEVRTFRLPDGDFLPDAALKAVTSPDAYSVFFEIRSAFQNTLASQDHFYERAIYIGEYLTDQRLTCITSDEVENVRAVLEHFRSQGRTRTGIFRYGPDDLTENLRINTWRNEMMAHGASFQWCLDHVFNCVPSNDYGDTQWIHDDFAELLSARRLADIDSLFIPLERHAALFERLCAENGIVIPRDLAIATQGVDSCVNTASPKLSHVDNRIALHLEIALDILEKRLAGTPVPPQLFTFYPTFIAADSSRCRPK